VTPLQLLIVAMLVSMSGVVVATAAWVAGWRAVLSWLWYDLTSPASGYVILAGMVCFGLMVGSFTHPI
jgi:hypothetical protein